eukprot:gnl/TRDRNA2_/TRDRNA2_171752_c0_seq1.p1 gnl/TRDRNA2_/TRDRNA2_171752_c0~~gnl/TRDRNA2_/TRDRNA2_171752_c0_seq1.p1  ORF type:complete len:293 (+),score=46.20 gnl/TRDRNA2_/TRDRNA2_171752_c0_seq1:114-992(+)
MKQLVRILKDNMEDFSEQITQRIDKQLSQQRNNRGDSLLVRESSFKSKGSQFSLGVGEGLAGLDLKSDKPSEKASTVSVDDLQMAGSRTDEPPEKKRSAESAAVTMPTFGRDNSDRIEDKVDESLRHIKHLEEHFNGPRIEDKVNQSLTQIRHLQDSVNKQFSHLSAKINQSGPSARFRDASNRALQISREDERELADELRKERSSSRKQHGLSGSGSASLFEELDQVNMPNVAHPREDSRASVASSGSQTELLSLEERRRLARNNSSSSLRGCNDTCGLAFAPGRPAGAMP